MRLPSYSSGERENRDIICSGEREREVDMEQRLEDVDGDEHERRGTVWTAASHIVTAVIGSGVLALAWSVAQLGWALGPLALLSFSGVTFYTSTLLADCYQSPHPITGMRSCTYMDVVKSYLGPKQVFMCGVAQHVNLWGTLVGYTITATASMIGVKRSNCFHINGQGARCGASGNQFMIIFGIIEVILSQFPSLENITWLSVLAAVMSFTYSFIGLALCIAKWISHGEFRGKLTGAGAMSPSSKAWNALQALGNIAFAYTFAEVLVEIQSTLKSPPPRNKTMKRATFYGIGLTTIFYLSLGCIGYAAFGNDSPGNILTGFGIYEPYWLIDIGNICIVVHLVGAYQVYAQPIFANFERKIASQWPEAKFIHTVYTVRLPLTNASSKPVSFTLSKLTLRSLFIVLTTWVAMLLPFFNAVLGLLGALSFWPLTVYFPVSMHMAQREIKRGRAKWVMLHSLSIFCLLVSLASSIGSVADIVESLKLASPFKALY